MWTTTFAGTGSIEGNSVAVDSTGNVHTTGYFFDTVDFDPGEGTANRTGGFRSNVFVSKLDAMGNFVWVKTFGGTGFDESHGIAVDTAGNVYTTGTFEGTVDFDPGEDSATLTSGYLFNSFVSKLDADGNFVWAKAIGEGGEARASRIALDSSRNVYTTGHFLGTADFDPGPGSVNLSSEGQSDIFVSKLNSSGNFVWAKAIGGTLGDEGRGIAVDASKNVYTTGSFARRVDFDPGVGTANLTGSADGNAFTLKLSFVGEGEGEGEGEPSQEIAQALIDDFEDGDTDDNGTLSFTEAPALFAALTLAEFNALDTDSNGELTQRERCEERWCSATFNRRRWLLRQEQLPKNPHRPQELLRGPVPAWAADDCAGCMARVRWKAVTSVPKRAVIARVTADDPCLPSGLRPLVRLGRFYQSAPP